MLPGAMLMLGDAKALTAVIRIVTAITSKCFQPRLWFRKGLKFIGQFLSSFSFLGFFPSLFAILLLWRYRLERFETLSRLPDLLVRQPLVATSA